MYITPALYELIMKDLKLTQERKLLHCDEIGN